MSSLLNVGSVTQFATTAACNFVLKKANVNTALPCSILGAAVQTASVYHKAIQKTSDIYHPPPSNSSSLSPVEEAVAGTLGAYAGYQVLKKGVSDNLGVVSEVASSSVAAGMAILGKEVATNLADTVKQTHSLGGLLTQFATTALCNNVGLVRHGEIQIGNGPGYPMPYDVALSPGYPVLCGVLSPAVQVAGNYIYHKAIQKTSDVPLSCSNSRSSLTSLEEAGAAMAGAGITSGALYSITKALGSKASLFQGIEAYASYMGISTTEAAAPYTNNIWLPMTQATQFTPLMYAGMAVIGTQVATNLADIGKRVYSSQASLETEERAPAVRIKV